MLSGERLSAEHFETLGRLVSTPSAYTQVDPKGDEVALQERIWEMLSQCDCRVSRQEMDDGLRFNIIAQKGAPIDEAEFVVLLYGHVDTIKKKPTWDSAYELSRRGEMLHGIGVYDMKAGLLVMIDAMRNVQVPPGMTVVSAFCVGEERDSDGVRKLMEWPNIQNIDLVLSPEIGAMGNDPQGVMLESDHPKDVIVGRPGNVKSVLSVTTPDDHGYKVNVPDANDAWRELLNHLNFHFNRRCSGSVRTHPDFGREFVRTRHMETRESGGGEFESVATHAYSRLAVRIAPPTTIEEIRRWQQQTLEELMRAERWAEFTESGTSYNPYVVRTDSPKARAVFRAVEEYYGGVRFSPGQAVADGAYGHHAMNRHIAAPTQYSIAQRTLRGAGELPPLPAEYVPWLDIGPLGQGAHKRTERVYEASLVRLLEFYRTLLGGRLLDHLRA